MKIRGLQDEDFVNYRKPSMFIGMCRCDWKCCNELGLDKKICQNSSLSESEVIDMSVDEIFHRYISNPITKAVVLGGLEPFLQFEEIYELIKTFRENGCDDDFVLYTGYYKEEIIGMVSELIPFRNIIVKYGRYIPGQESHMDQVLGIRLASDNQYGEKIC